MLSIKIIGINSAAIGVANVIAAPIGHPTSTWRRRPRTMQVQVIDSHTEGEPTRLVVAGGLEDGAYRAALEIDLPDGWHTYGRIPGDAGIPPIFDVA